MFRLIVVMVLVLAGANAAFAQSGETACPSTLDEQQVKRLRIVNSLGFQSSPILRRCIIPLQTAPANIDPHRSLFVHDRATLEAADFSLTHTLDELASQVVGTVPGTTAVGIFRQFWDTQNAAPGVTAGPHCTDNGGTVNGYPNSCRPNEGQEAIGTDDEIKARMKTYRVISLVNRLDLAHEGWRNCGEYRIIYGKEENGIQRNLIIFEAVLPNPKPGCREGCLAVAELWKTLSSIEKPVDRAEKLHEFFYKGLPGFRRVVHVDHYSAKGVSGGYGSSGSGQIRTNQFLQQPWLLKEFKTLIDCGTSPCKFFVVPIMVKVNPHGPLWNEDVANTAGPFQTRATAFQAAVLSQIPALANKNLTKFTYSVAHDRDAAQSQSQPTSGFVDNYLEQFNKATGAPVFRTALNAPGLSPTQIVNRAMTQSCAGCHMPRFFGLDQDNSLGSSPGSIPDTSLDTPTGGKTTKWPDALDFVHADTPISPLAELTGAAFGPNPGPNSGHRLSPALLEVFLPDRKNNFIAQLNAPRCFCSQRFPFLDKLKIPKALAAEERVGRLMEPKVRALNNEIKALTESDTNQTQREAVEKRLAVLSQEQDRQIDVELKKLQIKVPAITLKPQPLSLKAGRVARGNKQKEAELRQQELVQLIQEEPPRCTVTGSFRVH